jgi:hypothetical protein
MNCENFQMLAEVRTHLNQALPEELRPANLVDEFLSRSLAPDRILGGPFRGMRYIRESLGSVLLPKFLGTYEVELTSTLQSYFSDQPLVFVDVGSADGYFAAGLAWRCPKATVIAFEADEAGHKMITRVAELNGLVDRIKIRGFCSERELINVLQNCCPVLIIVDIEGGEVELLSPEVSKMLRRSDLIVEIHPWIFPDIETVLTSRFKSTHQINVIHTRERRARDLPFGAIVNRVVGRWIIPKLTELRPEPMRWLHLVAKR